ncbi:MAG: recombinase family protein [Alicyclobacillaceae bacterium]|nr:recombinase family protein [Alicyclobacillaceae bacterium]
MVKVCAVYARVSTDMQGESLENQVEYAKAYIQRLGAGFRVDETCVYTDADQSGYYTRFLHRPAIRAALRDAARGRFQVIVFKEISRISRDQAEHIEIVSRFQMHGVRVIAINDHLDSDRPETLDWLGIHSVMSELESKRISSRVSSGKRSLARRGVWNGEAPFGYRLNPDTRRLEVDPVHADTVRLIFRLYALHRWGALRIAQHLNQQGMRTKNGLLWSRVTVARVLRNPAYAGDTVYGRTRNTLRRIFDERGYSKVQGRNAVPPEDWVVVRDTHPALVDRETFRQVQLRMGRKEQTSSAQGRHPLSGILRCGRCGAGMVAVCKRWRDRQYRYYTCGRAFRSGRAACGQPNLAADGVERVLWEHLLERLHPYRQRSLEPPPRGPDDAPERRRSRVVLALRRAEVALARVMADEDIPEGTRERLKARYVGEIDRLERELKDLEGALLPSATEELTDGTAAAYLAWLAALGSGDGSGASPGPDDPAGRGERGSPLDTRMEQVLCERHRLFHGLLRQVVVDGYDIVNVEFRYRFD